MMCARSLYRAAFNRGYVRLRRFVTVAASMPLVAVACALLVAIDARAADVPSGNFAGSVAPDFELKALDGKTYSLSQFKGSAVVLSFWATWCAPCRIETKWMVALYKRLHADGLEILAVSMDDDCDINDVAKFAKTYGVNYPVLLQGQSIAERYDGVRYMPLLFFIDRNGKIVKWTRGARDEATLDAEAQLLLKMPAT
jgi:cytochrome c biogenesis protein CcmG/thiol:disulfide interchange protein DsbE